MPLKTTIIPRATKITLKVGIRANIGNYEDLSLEAVEEYSIDPSMNVEGTRSALLSNLIRFLQIEAAKMLEPLELSQNGKAPAGPLAIYLKEVKST